MPIEAPVHFNKKYLEEEIQQLAHLQEITLEAKPIQEIDKVLAECREILTEAYRVLARAAKQNRELSSAGEWLIDNFYIIQEQIVQLKTDLPKSYYKKLPRLIEGEYRGYPRTFEIVQLLASISDNTIDQENTSVAIKAYQEIDTLNLAEMWSVPLMNRLTLIIRLADRSKKLLDDRKIQNEIEEILNEKLDAISDEPGYLLRKLSEIVDSKRNSSRFLTILAQRLQVRGMLAETERRWFDYKFSRWESNLEEQLRDWAQQTSRLHLSIQNAISSLRVVSETDWSDFVENCSIVERILRLDPANMYQRMDFSTRDTYRKKVEKLSSHSKYTEQEVAEQVLLMAENAAQNGTQDVRKKMHVGYYLMGKGYEELVDELGYQKPWDEWLLQKAEMYPSMYFSLIGIHLLVLIAIAVLSTSLFSQSLWLILVTLGIALWPALELSVVSTNRILSFFVPPRILPKLEFKSAIPDEYRTVIIVPTLLSSVEDVASQVEQLEIRALGNANPSLQFALLSDFHDATEEKLEDDEAILEAAHHEIDQLNVKYHSNYGDKFLFFHRQRSWNESENCWMGWERKRGKIEEFNHLLQRSAAETTYVIKNEQFLQSLHKLPVQFVITLDSDTQLPPGSAKSLIGTAAHPLNRAELNANQTFVKDGYGIIQPRISIPPKSANKTWFSNIFSGNVGLDPYTTAVSDIYQDLFGEGIYTGKGLYDAKIFETVLGGRLPEDRILSHDLLESTFLRAALATDIELFDDYPTNYLSYSNRDHRWIRGDWQILSWLFQQVPHKEKGTEANPISGLSRWKIWDNMRRSLVPVTLIAFLLAAWTFLPGSAVLWTIAAFGVLAFPIYSSFSTDIFRRPQRVGWRLYLNKIRADLKMNTYRSVTSFLFLPHQAYNSMDAIVRTLYRMYISQQKLLEWTSASKVDREHAGGSLMNYGLTMWFNLFWGVSCLLAVGFVKAPMLMIAVPICLGWILAPGLAYYLSRPIRTNEPTLTKEDRWELRQYARRTWHFFEQYMTAEHSWLPPDNVQEKPLVEPAARTSPTNMGLSLVSICAAYKMGYLTVSEMVNRLQNTLESMASLERFRGHFYNWYSTKRQTLLHPHYVSTVDSGNLAASLIVVQQALHQLGEQQWPNPRFWDGFEDTLMVVEDLLSELDELKEHTALQGLLTETLDGLVEVFPKQIPPNIDSWKGTLERLYRASHDLKETDISELRKSFEELQYAEWKDWLSRPYYMIKAQMNELERFSEEHPYVISNSGITAGDYDTIALKYCPPFAETLKDAAELEKTCARMVEEMDFGLVYDEGRKLFSIGYNVERAAKDQSYYDLLASEARLASFIAIAKGEVPPEHWFQLSRRLTSIEQNEILLSWGGTMFEYLMPLLFMSRFDRTLLSDTYDKIVNWQKTYGELRKHPWGFSESGYNILNLELHYQYRAFGVPGLGLRRGLAEDYVVAPYASMLALMVHPSDALENLKVLKKEGGYGLSGFYEAIDYTTSRTNGNGQQDKAIVKMYMAHHQGMSLLSMVNILQDNIVQQLFHSHPLVLSCELLLQERIPRGIPIKEPRPIDVELEPAEEEEGKVAIEHSGINDLDNTPPRTHLLSNGTFSTFITHSGTGYAQRGETMLTRWRADVVQDMLGLFFYVRDVESGEFWSVGHQPVKKKADRYDSWFHAGKVQTARVDNWIESFMEVCVSPEENIELRKITLTNYSERKRKIEVTSYAEVVLNTQLADMSHPAFSNLFVQTEFLQEHHSLLAKRRPRESGESPQWLIHTVATEDMDREGIEVQLETDRGKFIGRNRSLERPTALDPGKKLSGTIGNVRDPIVSLRLIVTLKPGEKKNISFGLGSADSREEAVRMADQYDNPYAVDRVFELAAIYGKVEVEQLGLSGQEAHYFQKLAGYLQFNCHQLQADDEVLRRNRCTQSDLWKHGISGDVPMLVYHIDDTKYISQVKLLLKAQGFWRQRGLKVDLIFINDHPPSYIDELQESIQEQIQLSSERHKSREKGGVYVLRSDELSANDATLIDSVAKVVLKRKLPNLNALDNADKDTEQPSKRYKSIDLSSLEGSPDIEQDLRFNNGYGGFTLEGNEYVIRLKSDTEDGQLTFPPAPWINVIANPNFGFITSEKGSGYTWSHNSRENKLTPWSNDAVLDPYGEAFYLRDEQEKIFWSPLPGPIPGSSLYEIRHGFGYSRYQSETLNIRQEVTKWVPEEDSIKFIKLTLSNSGLMSKQLSVFRYVDWVLGVFREESTRHVATSVDTELQTIFARNHYNNEFAGRVAFSGFYTDCDYQEDAYTADRNDFIGRNNSLKNPKSLMYHDRLNERFGIGLESCAASQITLELGSGDTVDLYFFLGEAENEDKARELITAYQSASSIEQSLVDIQQFWSKKLQRIQVKTPTSEFNYLANGWLQYQNLVCRMWARTGFYQAGGAFGFRDQLQDAMAACYIDPQLSREQILLHAAHQFTEGDVLHWWHPPTDRGIRSRITDDLLWLPYVTAFYIDQTGDQSILAEQAPFVIARSLKDGEHEAYLHPDTTEEQASLYEHCCRAIDRSLTTGAHGLPLMGSGDWNDGMDRVGIEGRGESVWLGFFLFDILEAFIPICRRRKDSDRTEQYAAYKKELKKHLNNEGWDGEWYRRAYFDDGTPLGSSQNEECQIDAIAQAWSVISGAASPAKARKALVAANNRLVSESDGIIRLLTPPFDQTKHNPGYIKGYIPGVRENGGQYTHAAMWLIKAFAESGHRERAAQLMHMLTPVNKSRNFQEANRYRVEPYAVAADIYGEGALTGMGGWTWYTGSAGWMYRVMLESILGLRIQKGSQLQVAPLMLPTWKQYQISVRTISGSTVYKVIIVNPEGLSNGSLQATLDGKPLPVSNGKVVCTMVEDERTHELRIRVC